VDGHYRGVCAQALPSGSRANLKLGFNADSLNVVQRFF
jgi:hypothetical protein